AWLDTAPPELAARLREMTGPDGWLPPWPRWWGEEALAGLLPDPGARERFIAGCPPLPLALFADAHARAPFPARAASTTERRDPQRPGLPAAVDRSSVLVVIATKPDERS